MKLATAERTHLVVGMGKTGQSCARFLAARGLQFAMTDSRHSPPLLGEIRAEFPGIELHTGKFDTDMLAAADEIILSPGVNPAEPALLHARAGGAVLLGDIELFFREARAPIVAITGTNAKSTVTTLVGLMAEAAGRKVGCGGNLGTPALDLLSAEIDLYVLELSSFQLETVIDFRADVAAMLNFAPDHLDRYAGIEEYHRAKQRVFRNAACAVFNRDDPCTFPPVAHGQQLSFGLGAPQAGEFGLVVEAGQEYLAHAGERLLAVAQLGLSGRHNVANSLAAMAIATAAGIATDAQTDVLRRYRGLPHRCQLVRRLAGVDYYDDSKGTNVAAAVAALRGLAAACLGRVVLIAGGVAKESDFSALAIELARCARAAVLIGNAAPALAAALEGSVDVVFANSMDDAVSRSRDLVRGGDIVLLSPACASFDMFRNYEERGEAFARAVNALPSGEVR